jgi:hypothetical protein
VRYPLDVPVTSSAIGFGLDLTCMCDIHHREAVMAFIDKRAPQFQ